MAQAEAPEKLLIFRIGSLGDTCVALPCFHAIRAKYPQSDIRLLSNTTRDGVAPVASVLINTNLINGVFEYPVDGSPFVTWRKLKAWSPDALIYLMPPRRRDQIVRDWIFFRSAGIKQIHGMHFATRYHRHHEISPGLHESEANRLARTLNNTFDVALGMEDSWNLCLTENEILNAKSQISPASTAGYLACAVGCNMPSKNWGLDRWCLWAKMVSNRFPNLTLLMLGGPQDKSDSSSVISNWRGVGVNLCGMLSPRESAGAIAGAAAFVGHDSGPMHLAASVGVPIVALFSARSPPGIWFPHGAERNIILHHRVACEGCALTVCTRQNECMRAITVEDAFSATIAVLNRSALC
jgi:heptosyltransferase-3